MLGFIQNYLSKKLIATCYATSPIAQKELSLFPDLFDEPTEDRPSEHRKTYKFLDKYNPEQFEIIEGSNRYGILNFWGKNDEIQAVHSHGNNINGKTTYFRIHIRRKNSGIIIGVV